MVTNVGDSSHSSDGRSSSRSSGGRSDGGGDGAAWNGAAPVLVAVAATAAPDGRKLVVLLLVMDLAAGLGVNRWGRQPRGEARGGGPDAVRQAGVAAARSCRSDRGW